MTIAIIVFVALPLLVTVLAKIFYNFFFPLTKINATAAAYDKEVVKLPETVCNVKNLRTLDKIGDKIVYTQHLAPLVNDYRDTVMRVLMETLVVEFILIFVLALGAASLSKDGETGIHWKNVEKVLEEWKVQYLYPIGMVALCLKFVYQFFFLSEQISKYKKNS